MDLLPLIAIRKNNLVLHRQHLYVAKGVGLAVIDVSDATDPREVHCRDFPCRGGKPGMQPGER